VKSGGVSTGKAVVGVSCQHKQHFDKCVVL